MEAGIFSSEDNSKISLACCFILVNFSSYPSNERTTERNMAVTDLIRAKDWVKLFQNKTWLGYLKKAVNLKEEVKPVLDQLEVLGFYFKEKLISLVGSNEPQPFEKKDGEIIPFGELPEGKKFFLEEGNAPGAINSKCTKVQKNLACQISEKGEPFGNNFYVDKDVLIIYMSSF